MPAAGRVAGGGGIVSAGVSSGMDMAFSMVETLLRCPSGATLSAGR